MKTQKGITLIALIITIIVMLILVGVSVTVALNGGLFNTAQKAAEGTKVAGEKERILSIVLGALDNEGKVVFDDKLKETLEDEGFTLNGNTITSEETGKTYEVSQRGSVTEQTAREYTIGDEVTVSGENFYVIGQDGDTLTLLAKYDIDKETLKQKGGDIRADDVPFATGSTSYWSTYNGSYPLNLNEYEECPEGSAIDIAKQYAEEITGSRENGRLMTKGEAESLNTTDEYKKILYGYYSNNPYEEYLTYWLGSAKNSTDLYIIYGFDEGRFEQCHYNDGDNWGVRPVIVISKSAIQ